MAAPPLSDFGGHLRMRPVRRDLIRPRWLGLTSGLAHNATKGHKWMAMIRLGKPSDAPAVHALLWAAKDKIPLNDNFADAAHQQWVLDQCNASAVWVVDSGTEVIGAMVMKPRISPPEVFYLVVAEENRKQGIGRALISQAKQIWKTGLRARAKPYNKEIIGLLTSEGFEPQSNSDRWVWYSWCPE